jgi:hypothetical protein
MVNEKWKLRFGREAFRQFIVTLSAFQARNASPYDRDPPFPPFHRVTREEMLDQFLALRPDLDRFRDEFARMDDIIPDCYVNSISWQQLVAG